MGQLYGIKSAIILNELIMEISKQNLTNESSLSDSFLVIGSDGSTMGEDGLKEQSYEVCDNSLGNGYEEDESSNPKQFSFDMRIEISEDYINTLVNNTEYDDVDSHVAILADKSRCNNKWEALCCRQRFH